MNYPEILEAICKVIEARSNINCCVNFNKEDIENADYLYWQCKRYCEDYKEFKKRMEK